LTGVLGCDILIKENKVETPVSHQQSWLISVKKYGKSVLSDFRYFTLIYSYAVSLIMLIYEFNGWFLPSVFCFLYHSGGA
ncbi:MAG: hypothetical protein ACOC17_02380, partial [Halanaerobium sp.]